MNPADGKLMEEVRLAENITEREQMDNACEMYAVLNTLEQLEKAFARDSVPAKEYTAECAKLLGQFVVTKKLLETHMSVEDFIRTYSVKCTAAMDRIREGRPLTVRDDKGNKLKCIADIVELGFLLNLRTLKFITLLDQLKLNTRAVDDLYPTLNELYASLSSMASIPEDFDARAKVRTWHDRLKAMSASEELSDESARQMIFEIETAYNSFQRFLKDT